MTGALTEIQKKRFFEVADTEILTFGSTVMADANGDVEVIERCSGIQGNVTIKALITGCVYYCGS